LERWASLTILATKKARMADRLDKAGTGYQNVELALFLADRLKKAIKVGSDGSTSLE
jgi:hypothetical protein